MLGCGVGGGLGGALVPWRRICGPKRSISVAGELPGNDGRSGHLNLGRR